MRIPIDLLIHPEYLTFRIAELDTPIHTTDWKECLWHMVCATGASASWTISHTNVDWSTWLKEKYLAKIAEFRQVQLIQDNNHWIILVDKQPVSKAHINLNSHTILSQLSIGLFNANGLDYAFQAHELKD